MTKFLVVAFILIPLVVVAARPVSAQDSPGDPNPFARVTPARPLGVREKFVFHLRKTYGPGALLSAAASSALNQWRNFPEEWGQGMEGYGRRFGSRVAQGTAQNLIKFGVGAALREDPRYFPAETKGVFSRTGHAIGATLVTRTDSGGRAPAISRFAGIIGSAFLANQWHPQRINDTNHALGRAAISLGAEAGWNIFREFWPDVKKAFRRQ